MADERESPGTPGGKPSAGPPRSDARESAPAAEQQGPLPHVTLPKGGGAIRGIGEKFAANPVTGTASFTLPLPISPGRSGFAPQLSLSYDAGAGNSVFGWGFTVGLPAITRKTDKGLPQYRDAEDSDAGERLSRVADPEHRRAPIRRGCGCALGIPHIAHALEAVSHALQVQVGDLTFQSTNAGRKAGFQRNHQERLQQANAAGYELKSIDKQIVTQQVRIALANQEITNQQKQIDNAQEMDDFLRNQKYTNQELFTWMADSLRTTYRQAYNLAYEIAKKAEKAYRFERGLTDAPSIIQYGYWNAGYDGLLAGEQLYVDLKKLEAAHQDKRAYDYEITRPISLRQIDPLALLRLRDSGICEVTLPEILFDMDYPGHYMRRIKSVALTVPCIIGPYTSLNCTLRLLEHSFRTKATVSAAGTDYPMKTDESDERFTSVNVPITAIAVSTGQSDAGVFELNFRDERYIPFEGAGAISRWRIELPKDFRQFDYETISDVILHVRYTSLEGGESLKGAATKQVKDYVASIAELSQREGLFAAFDLVHDLPNEWYRANRPQAGTSERVLPLASLSDRLPIVARNFKVQLTDVYLVSPAALPSTTLTIAGHDTPPLENGVPVGKLNTLVAHNLNTQLRDLEQLTIGNVTTKISALWLVVRYALRP